MLKEFPDAVIFPCQLVTKFIPLTVKLTVPVKLPFDSTCAVIVVGAVPPCELLTEPLKTPFASTATDIVPLTGMVLLLYVIWPDQTPVPDP
jgi:hypothetical protein